MKYAHLLLRPTTVRRRLAPARALRIHRAPARSGYTLVEIMLVLSIIALLMGGGIAFMNAVKDDAKKQKAAQDIRQLGVLLSGYEMDAMKMPTTAQGLDALMNKPSNEPVPKRWSPRVTSKDQLTDPWGGQYKYVSPGKHNPRGYDLYSAGPDGQEGTDDDIGNWE